MHFASDSISPKTAYRLLVSTVLPRPIAFITTVDSDGRQNAAPFSFFNVMGSEPPVVAIGFEPKSDKGVKDTLANIRATKSFVVNLVDEPLAAQMNIAAASVEPDVNELELAGLATTPSVETLAPRIAASPVSLECTLYDEVELTGGGAIIVGEVLHFHVRDELVVSRDPIAIDLEKLSPISRLSGPFYGRVTDTFQITRPK